MRIRGQARHGGIRAFRYHPRPAALIGVAETIVEPELSEPRFYFFMDFAALVFFRAERAAGVAFATALAVLPFFAKLPSPMLFANSDRFAA